MHYETASNTSNLSWRPYKPIHTVICSPPSSVEIIAVEVALIAPSTGVQLRRHFFNPLLANAVTPTRLPTHAFHWRINSRQASYSIQGTQGEVVHLANHASKHLLNNQHLSHDIQQCIAIFVICSTVLWKVGRTAAGSTDQRSVKCACYDAMRTLRLASAPVFGKQKACRRHLDSISAKYDTFSRTVSLQNLPEFAGSMRLVLVLGRAKEQDERSDNSALGRSE